MIGNFLLLLAFAANDPSSPIPYEKVEAGRIIKIDGEKSVRIIDPVSQISRHAKEEDSVYTDEKLITKSDQSVAILLQDKSRVTIGPDSSFVIERFSIQNKSQHVFLKLFYGLVETWVKKLIHSEDEFVISTPSAAMGVRGTHFTVQYDSSTQTTSVHTFSGVVAMAPSYKALRTAASLVRIDANQMSSMQSTMKGPEPARSFEKQNYLQQFRKKVPIDTPKLNPPKSSKNWLQNFIARPNANGPDYKHPGLRRNAAPDNQRKEIRESNNFRKNMPANTNINPSAPNAKPPGLQQNIIPKNNMGPSFGAQPGAPNMGKPAGPPPGAPPPPPPRPNQQSF